MENWTNLIENEWCFSFCTRIPIILEHLRYFIFMETINNGFQSFDNKNKAYMKMTV